jgi:hypothetical protein
MPEVEERPVLWGLVALVSVALVIGLVTGLAVLGGTKVLGLDGGDADASGEATAENSLYLPKPAKTDDPSGPSITLEPGETDSDESSEESAEDDEGKEKKEKKPKKAISLSASQLSVSAMQQIDLTGTYPGGEGAILQVQRFENGAWSDFPVTVSVSNQTFSTYVQTSQPGPNRFRVVDTDTRKASNEVKVTVG